MLERLIEKEFCEYARSLGCIPVKLEVANDRGWPDRMVLCPGNRVLFLEFKQQAGKKSPHQLQKQKQLRSLGFTSEFVFTLAAARKTLDDFLQDS